MLTNLLVRNIALVEEAQIDFHEGLNILTGETGAGKSILLGAMNLALGAKAGADYIGRFGESAYVELTFHIDSEERLALLRDMDIEAEYGDVVISRKLLPNKSVMKINGESSNQTNVRKVTELLLDIHGQHDHQSLLYRNKQLDILDRYARTEVESVKIALMEHFKAYQSALNALADFDLDEEDRKRNISFIEFELKEIESANLIAGEDEDLEQQYKRMLNGKRIAEELSKAYAVMDSSVEENASSLLNHAYGAMSSVSEYDDEIRTMQDELSNIDSLLSELSRELSEYLSSLEYDDAEFYRVEHRLNDLNHLKSKYGKTLEEVFSYAEDLQKKLDFYADYEAGEAKAQKQKEESLKLVEEDCKVLHELRLVAAQELEKAIVQALLDLNFGQVQFEIAFESLDAPTKNGQDTVEFMISLNPGETCKPLSKVASGGEMSRIMLGIKSVLAGKDDIDTLIFDEIDSGISGRTAQMVSQKMAHLSKNHQLICITHLPQIAAMADTHFLIEKNVENGYTQTYVKELDESMICEELSRMLGGMSITDTVRENAVQMKKMADEFKRESI